jgi:hypothetical protein
MAIIQGQALPPDPRAAGAVQRVVVKLRTGAAPPAPGVAADAPLADIWSDLGQRYPGVTVQPYFSDAVTFAAPAISPAAATQIDPQRYLAVNVPAGIAAEDVASTVRNAAAVESAYPEGGPMPPPVGAADDPRSANQGYLNAAPHGIDARWVWQFASIDGSGVGFVDLEQGWTLNHEDLAAAGITLISGQNKAYTGHGTAVLGEVAAVDNTRGGIGIAPAVSTRVISQWRTASIYSTADAILDAANNMTTGDVLLLEAQTTYPTTTGFVPVEVEDLVFEAIRTAVSRGIVVIEAAGNGSVNLDLFQDVSGKQILNRTSADFRDSGAILVGAASASAPHTRLPFSNFGGRVDCFAWGERIDTCGDGWTSTDPSTYTTNFGGTSGASPIVAGAALLLQAFRIGSGQPRVDPGTLRAVLSTPLLNTASAQPAVDLIGVMPNLRAIIEWARTLPSGMIQTPAVVKS